MIAGKMNKRILLQKPNVIPDGAGGLKPGTGGKWADVVTVWAEFRKPNMQTDAANGAIISDMIREISIRYRDDVRKGWRVLYSTNKIFSVEHTYDYGRETTVLVCREVVK